MLRSTTEKHFDGLDKSLVPTTSRRSIIKGFAGLGLVAATGTSLLPRGASTAGPARPDIRVVADVRVDAFKQVLRGGVTLFQVRASNVGNVPLAAFQMVLNRNFGRPGASDWRRLDSQPVRALLPGESTTVTLDPKVPSRCISFVGNIRPELMLLPEEKRWGEYDTFDNNVVEFSHSSPLRVCGGQVPRAAAGEGAAAASPRQAGRRGRRGPDHERGRDRAGR